MASSVSPQPAPGDAGWHGWEGDALVVGCGGIGQALLRELPRRAPGLRLWAASSSGWQPQEDLAAALDTVLPLDLSEDSSLAEFSERLRLQGPALRLVINTAGLLHGTDLQPEKRLTQVNRPALERSFSVNAFGAILLAQAVEPHLAREAPVHFASLSARVGSIGDNQLGGWYSYRAAKAAQNQLLRTLAVEWRRRLPQACVTLLHPGTTATGLSAPFRSSVPPAGLFTPARAAAQLLDVLEQQTPERSGSFLAWDGAVIPW